MINDMDVTNWTPESIFGLGCYHYVLFGFRKTKCVFKGREGLDGRAEPLGGPGIPVM
jgi:hypothetical protein